MVCPTKLAAVTQARNVREVDEMATGLVIAGLDPEEGDVKTRVSIELPASVTEAWREASVLQAKAETDQKRAATLRRRPDAAFADSSSAWGTSGSPCPGRARRKHQRAPLRITEDPGLRRRTAP